LLNGTEAYGDPTDNSKPWAIKFNDFFKEEKQESAMYIDCQLENEILVGRLKGTQLSEEEDPVHNEDGMVINIEIKNSQTHPQ